MDKNVFNIPENFRTKIQCCFREKGDVWLKGLPELLDRFIQKWELTDCRPEENLSYHYILYARSPKYGDVVLKTGVPHLELFSGMDALHLYGGKYACKLYEMDRKNGIMLMERIIPGTRLRDENDFNLRIQTGMELVRKLPVEINGQHDFPVYKTQMEKAYERARREGRSGEDFISLLRMAEKLYDEIQSLSSPKVLLDGDLHHENILKDAAGSWKVIDPQGRIGEQCLEVGRFLLNEWDWFGGIGDAQHMAQCIDSFAQAMGESRRTIAISCFLDYAISSCWTLEDGGKPDDIKDAVLQMKCLLEIM